MIQRKSRAARKTRSNPTSAEDLLWKYLRGRHAGGFKFRRQHAVDAYVIDLYCPEAKLVVELDGSIHRERQHYDTLRPQRLEGLGLRVMRFPNEEAIKDTSAVVSKIVAACRARNAQGPLA